MTTGRPRPVAASRTFEGVPASAGVAAGPARILAAPGWILEGPDPAGPSDPERDARRVDEALDHTGAALRALEDRLRAAGRTEEADIVGVGALIADDPALRAEAHREVGGGHSPAEAMLRAAERYAAAFVSMG